MNDDAATGDTVDDLGAGVSRPDQRPRRLQRRALEAVARRPAIGGIVAFAVLGAVATASRPASLTIPLDRDTGSYLYIGDVILHGGMPYSDAADNKGPLTFLLFALIRLLADGSATLVRGALLVFAALTALAVAGYVTRFAGRTGGVVAGLTTAVLLSTKLLEGDDPNTEQFGVAPMAAAWYLATRGGAWPAAGAGALCAGATMMNVGFVPIVAIVLFELIRVRGPTSFPARILAAAAGGLALTALVLGWLLAGGALHDMTSLILGKAAPDVGKGSVVSRLNPLELFDVPAKGLLIVGLAGAIAGLWSRRLRPAAVGALVWILVMRARVAMSSAPSTQHFYVMMPGIAAGLAVGALAVWRRDSWARRAAAVVLVAVPIYLAVAKPQLQAIGNPAWPKDVDADLNLAYPAARFVRAHTAGDDPVFFTGFSSTAYWLADRRAPTRFFFVSVTGQDKAFVAERRRMLLRRPPVALGELPGAKHRERRKRDVLPDLLRHFDYRLAWKQDGGRVWLLHRGGNRFEVAR